MAQRISPFGFLKPTEKDLDFVAGSAGDNWRSLLTHLGIKLVRIDSFQKYYGTKDACFKGLVHWLKENVPDEPVTFDTLFQALEDSAMTGCISLLEEKLKARSRLNLAEQDLSTQITNAMSRVLHFSQRFPDSLKVTGVGPMGRRLGRGSDTALHEVEWQGTLCAAKVLHEILLNDDTPGGSQKFVADFENECITWSKLLRPRVVQFLAIYFQPGCTIPILLLEKMDTSLRTHLEEHSREECSLSDKIHILRQAVQGLAYIHSFQPPLVHHDLSPNNTLLNRASNLAKLTDFGMTRIVDPSGGSRKSSMKGTVAFMPPEALVEPLRYDEKLDVFSFGNVIITILTHAWPNPAAPIKYKGDRLVGVSEFECRQQDVIQFTEEESALFLEMVRSCLENRPNLHPTSLQLVDQMKQMEGVHPRKAVGVKTSQIQPKWRDADSVSDSDLEVAQSTARNIRIKERLQVVSQPSLLLSVLAANTCLEKLVLQSTSRDDDGSVGQALATACTTNTTLKDIELVPLSSPEAVQREGKGEDGPSYSQSTTSAELPNIFDEDAALYLGIVAALDPSAETPPAQQRSFADKWLDKDPPVRKLQTAFFRLQSRLAILFDEHIDHLKPFLRTCQKHKEWPYKLLEVEDIDNARTFRAIFNKVRIEDFWLNTDMLIRLSDALPDKKSREKVKQHLEAYHKLLGVFSKFVLLKHIPRDDASFYPFFRQFPPKLRVRDDVDIEDFYVSKLLKQQEFLSRMFSIPKEAFHYLEAEPMP